MREIIAKEKAEVVCHVYFSNLTHILKILSLDIDECLKESSHECDLNATCINTPGSYTCLCRNGNTGDGKTCAGTLASVN